MMRRWMMKNFMKSRQRMRLRILGEARDAMLMLGGRTGFVMMMICHEFVSPQSGDREGGLQTVLVHVICDTDQAPNVFLSFFLFLKVTLQQITCEPMHSRRSSLPPPITINARSWIWNSLNSSLFFSEHHSPVFPSTLHTLSMHQVNAMYRHLFIFLLSVPAGPEKRLL